MTTHETAPWPLNVNWSFITLMTRRLTRKKPAPDWAKKPKPIS
ncbi:hypothetical protein [Streptomyces sp. NPDC005077]